jgi:two-component system nitrate/nitrite response regulator NarL
MLLRVTTAIVEPNMLIREGLTSLLERYSYRIVGSASGVVELVAQSPPEPPKLVLVGAETVENAVLEARKSRDLWPASKIVLLLEARDNDDFRQMMASEIDGCVPRSVSQTTLMRTVDLVMLEDARVLVMIGQPHRHIRLATSEAKPLAPSIEHPHNGDATHHNGNGNGSAALAGPVVLDSPRFDNSRPDSSLLDSPRLDSPRLDSPRLVVNGLVGVTPILPTAEASQAETRPRVVPRLSERETQILDSIVHGYSNKLIARKCGITEATVKVHMKSILRKIQVVNRTQAAVWAMENGCAAPVEKRMLEADAEGGAAA